MDCSLPGSSVHEYFQARVLEWVAISFSKLSSQPRDQTRVSHTAGRCFPIRASPSGKPKQREAFLFSLNILICWSMTLLSCSNNGFWTVHCMLYCWFTHELSFFRMIVEPQYHSQHCKQIYNSCHTRWIPRPVWREFLTDHPSLI